MRNINWKNNISEIEFGYRQDTILLKKNLTIVQYKKKESALTALIISILSIMFGGIGILLFINAIKKYNSEKNRKKLLIRLNNLRIQNAKNRLSPHFLFNILNVLLPSVVEKSNQRKSLDELIIFLRLSILSSNNISTTIGEEIDMVKHYIKLRKIYSNDVVMPEWEIKDESVLTMSIPSMILQIPIENAITYAFTNSTDKEKSIKVT